MIVTFMFVKIGLISIVFAEWFSNWFDSEPIHMLGPNSNIFVSSKQNCLSIFSYKEINKSIVDIIEFLFEFLVHCSLNETYVCRFNLNILVPEILSIRLQ